MMSIYIPCISSINTIKPSRCLIPPDIEALYRGGKWKLEMIIKSAHLATATMPGARLLAMSDCIHLYPLAPKGSGINDNIGL